MRAIFWRFMLLLVVVAGAAGGWWAGGQPAFSQTPTAMAVEDFWAPPVSPPNMALVYGVLKNVTGHDDTLIAARTPVAKQAAFKLHLAKNERLNIEKDMERTVRSIDLPKDKYQKLGPTGFYIVLGELTEELKSGQSFPITLQFQSAAQVTATVKISTSPPPLRPFSYTGGDGSSSDKYIVIHGARDPDEVNAATLAWLATNYPEMKMANEGIAVSRDGTLLRVIMLCRGTCQPSFGMPTFGDKQVYFKFGDPEFALIDPNAIK